jgi:hypothetical protein
MLSGFESRGNQRTGIHAAFFQIKSGSVGIGKSGLQSGEWSGERVLRHVGRGKNQRPLIAEINVDPRLILQLMSELWVHASAGNGERSKCSRHLEPGG